jgi:hypothetical protein
MTPTARSLIYLRRQGFLVEPVERWLPGTQIRKDLFGCGDLIAAHPRDKLIVLVQVTTADHIAHRLAKARARPELRDWIRAGGLFSVHGWQKRAGRWHCRVVSVSGEDLQPDLTPRLKRGRGRPRGLFDGHERRERPAEAPGIAQDAARADVQERE